MLTVVFGCTKFHDYIYGMRNVEVESDHKPLETLQKMLMAKQKYSLNVTYWTGKQLVLYDALSWIYLPERVESLAEKFDITTYKLCQSLSQGYTNWQNKPKKDSHLQQLASVITTGWPGTKQDTPSSCLPYWNYCDKLSVCDYIIFKCEKTVIPNRMQHEMLDTIHSSHLGVENAKGKQEMLCYGLAWPPRSKTLLQTATSAVLTNETIQRNQW